MAQVAAAHAVEASPHGNVIPEVPATHSGANWPSHKALCGEARKILRISDHFDIGKKLGSGYTATVYEARCRATGRMVAVKDIDKSRQRLIASDEYYRLVYATLSRLPPHRHLLLPPLALLESPTHFYIVMELCHGRDLVDYVLNHPPGGIATSSCRRLMQQLLLGVHFLHSYNILHRDIKLDNIIFRQTESSTNADVGQTGDLALLDFDMCLLNHTDPPRPPLGSNEISVVGTREYMAPECFRGQYSTASDIWSLGVILYVLLDGHFPFNVYVCGNNSKTGTSSPPQGGKEASADADPKQQQQSNVSGRAIRRLLRQGVQFFSGVKARHPVATDLVERMLTFDARVRMQTAFDALHHPWLLPVPSPVPRQQQRQQCQSGPLVALQQEALDPSETSAATEARSHREQTSDAAAEQKQQGQQQLLHQRHVVSKWGTFPGGSAASLARIGQPKIGPPSDAPASRGIVPNHVHNYLRQHLARQPQISKVAQQHDQRSSTAAAASRAAPARYLPDGMEEPRRSRLTAAVVAGVRRDFRRHQQLQQQQQQSFAARQPKGGHQHQPQDSQRPQAAVRDYVGPPRSSMYAFEVSSAAGPGGPRQQLEAFQQRVTESQARQSLKQQTRAQQKCFMHLPQSAQPREGATLSSSPGSVVSTRLPSSMPPSSQPSDFLGHAGTGAPLSSPARFSCDFRGQAAAAANPAHMATAAAAAAVGTACTHGSITPYSSTATTASCSKPPTPSLESLPARRDDASAAVAVQLQQQPQQQRSAGGQRTVSRTAPLCGVSLVLQLQQRLQQQQQQQQLAQLQNRHFQLHQQLQHQLLQQSVPRNPTMVGTLPLSAVEPPRLQEDFAAAKGLQQH